MSSLVNACRIARLRKPWSARALATAYQVAPPISVAELIERVMGYSSFDKIKRFFVLVLENRSFDHMLGFSQIGGIDAVTGEETGIKGLSDIHAVSDGLEAKECNMDSSGKCWRAAAPTELKLRIDPGHLFCDMHEQHKKHRPTARLRAQKSRISTRPSRMTRTLLWPRRHQASLCIPSFQSRSPFLTTSPANMRSATSGSALAHCRRGRTGCSSTQLAPVAWTARRRPAK